MTALIHINVIAQSIPCIHWGHLEGTEMIRVIKTESIPHAKSHTALDANVSHYSHLLPICLLTLSSALRKWKQEVKRFHVRI